MGLADLFYRGKYVEILEHTLDSPHATFLPADYPYIVGALTFRGRIEEAKLLCDLHRDNGDKRSVIFARFFLGVGYCRHSYYDRARQCFAKNLRQGGRHSCAEVRFYAWQGVSFYRLFTGRYSRGLFAAMQARKAAIEANFLYGRTLSADMMAHNQIQPGQISKALHSFDEAERYAEHLGSGGIVQAVRVSKVIHSAQFGLDPANDVNNLVAMGKALNHQDNYSHSRLQLELSRQLVLRGQVDQAWDALNQACKLIYGSNNRRYSIILNLRYAYILFLRGDFDQAINLVRNARKELDPDVDRSLEFEVLGLEKLISTKREDFAQTFDERHYRGLMQLQNRSGKAINLRITGRQSGKFYNQMQLGDDPLGDLVDLCCNNEESAKIAVANSPYKGLFLHLLNGLVGKKLIVFDFIPGSMLVLDHGNVLYHATCSSSIIRGLARELARQESSKQSLIENVWRYKYNPLNHDSLIYRNISRFRSLLGGRDWILATEFGYRLIADVSIRMHRPDALAGASIDAQATMYADKINHRQIQLLDRMSTGDYVNVKAYCESFAVSEITARRDLSELTRSNLLRRIGQGRATRYQRP